MNDTWLIVFGGIGTAFVSTLITFVIKKLDRNWDLLTSVQTNQERVLERLDHLDNRILQVEAKTERLSGEVDVIVRQRK